MSQGNVQDKIRTIVQSEDIVLFMKGSKSFPQCGFSATVVQILSGLVGDFHTVNVLSDPEIRNGIKEFSSWPTIPQLYFKGDFIGGCDIVKELYESGELPKTLGVELGPIDPPNVKVTDSAQAVLKDALAESGDSDVIHLSIDAKFGADLHIAPATATAIKIEAGVPLVTDRASVPRAEGVIIDYVEESGRAGFKIENPNAPAEVVQLNAEELKNKMDAGEIKHVLDVRTPKERETASIADTRLLDETIMEEIEALPAETPIAFFCHHGSRSQAAAEHFRDRGFRKLYNLAGGIDAWAMLVDSSVPRY